MSEMRYFFEEVCPRAWEQQPRTRRTAPRKERSTAQMLMCTSMHGASEPKDKVFAIVGLQPAKSKESLLPDYSLSISEVYQRAMMEMLSESVHWLETAAEQDSNLDRPSWCIDFSAGGWCSGVDEKRTGHGQAGLTGDLPDVTRDAKSDAISLPGLRLGVIDFVTRREKSLVCEKESRETPFSPTKNGVESTFNRPNPELDDFFNEMALFAK